MDDQSLVWMTSLDSWEVMVVIAVIALISSVFSERQKSVRKHTDPKVLDLSDYLGTHRPHPQVTGHCKPKP